MPFTVHINKNCKMIQAKSDLNSSKKKKKKRKEKIISSSL